MQQLNYIIQNIKLHLKHKHHKAQLLRHLELTILQYYYTKLYYSFINKIIYL